MEIAVEQESEPQREDTVTLPSGRSVALPARYANWSVAGALFPAHRASLRDLLPEPLVPATVGPGLGAIAVAGIDYVETAVGPYNEVAISIPASERAGLPGQAAYIHALPVTTEDARDLGRQVWNYPKSLADLTIDRSSERVRVEWYDEDAHVLTLTVPAFDGQRRRNEFVTYSGDGPIRTRISAHGEFGLRPLADATLELGSTDVAGTVEELLASERAFLATTGRNIRSRLPRGERVTEK